MKPVLNQIALFRAFFQKPGTWLSSEELEQSTSLSGPEIHQAIETLRSLGYPFEKLPHRGYCLGATGDIWCPEELLARLDLHPLHSVSGAPRDPTDSSKPHWRVSLFQSTSSTNDLVWREAKSGAAAGLVAAAQEQTRGRGRQGRTWSSSKSMGLYVSWLEKPDWPLSWLTRLTILTSLAAAEALEEAGIRAVAIKWPNDLVVEKQKIGGILIEAQAHWDRIGMAVIGVGLNVHHSKEDFPQEIRNNATSVFLATGKRVRRADLLLALLERFQKRLQTPFEETRALWIKRCLNLGQPIQVRLPDGACHDGQALGIDEHGNLLLRRPSGQFETISCGELVTED